MTFLIGIIVNFGFSNQRYWISQKRDALCDGFLCSFLCCETFTQCCIRSRRIQSFFNLMFNTSNAKQKPENRFSKQAWCVCRSSCQWLVAFNKYFFIIISIPFVECNLFYCDWPLMIFAAATESKLPVAKLHETKTHTRCTANYFTNNKIVAFASPYTDQFTSIVCLHCSLYTYLVVFILFRRLQLVCVDQQ